MKNQTIEMRKADLVGGHYLVCMGKIKEVPLFQYGNITGNEVILPFTWILLQVFKQKYIYEDLRITGFNISYKKVTVNKIIRNMTEFCNHI